MDFDHAFDRVSHNYIIEVLRALGFVEPFNTIIHNILQGGTSRISYNGHLTKSININRGVRQGCPLSMTLFVLSLEPLLSNLNLNMYGNALDIFAYADDVTVIKDGNVGPKHILKNINEYNKYSGAKINWKKSHTNMIGNVNRQKTHTTNWLSSKEEAKILGITFFNSIHKMGKKNWTDALTSVRGALNQGKHRALTLQQRIKYVNEFALSKPNSTYATDDLHQNKINYRMVPMARSAVTTCKKHSHNAQVTGRLRTYKDGDQSKSIISQSNSWSNERSGRSQIPNFFK